MPRKKVIGVKPPKEKAEFKDAPQEVLELAARMIDKNHTHLAEAHIKYVFRTGKWEQRGRTIYGTAQKVPGKMKFLTGYDFIVTLNKDVWTVNKQAVREALLDHELTHCARGDDDKQGNPRWYLMPHTVEDFPSVIRRHGLWTESLVRMVKAKEDYEQLSLVSKTGTEG